MQGRQPTPIGEGRPVWDDDAPAQDMAALDPGPPDALPRRPDVLVIGGGQVGLATAAMCTRAGLGSVLLVERDRLAGGPSGRNGGFLLVDVHRSWPSVWRELSVRAFALHRELDAQWGHGLLLLDLWTREGLLASDQGHVNPLRVAAGYARNAGVVATGVEAISVELNVGRVRRVRTSHGDVEPGMVVFATGSCPPDAGDVRQDFVKGHVIATEPASFPVERMLMNGEVGVVQLADGRLVCGGTKDFDDATLPVVDKTVTRLRDALVELVPEAHELALSHAWSCFRPRTADELPVIDRLPGASNAFVAAGLFSTGVLMAPVVGEIVARLIVDGTPPDDLAMFALSRDALAAQAVQDPVPTGDVLPRA